MNLRNYISRTLTNMPGWQTKRKIVVIESDDWGSERTPSKDVYNYLLRKGLKVDECPYSRYDSLASEDDLINLFDILSKFKDKNNQNPIITANTNVVNPDFYKIKQTEYNEFHFAKFTDVLKKYPNHSNSFDLWQDGINNRLFYPQFHGREHLNPIIWLEQLRENHRDLRIAFDVGVYGLSGITSPLIKKKHLASLIYRNELEKKYVQKTLIEGSKIFDDIFHYKSISFIAPVSIWNRDLETTLFDCGIKYIQGANLHSNYYFGKKKEFVVDKNYTGQRNKLNQTYLARNCSFEPSTNPKIDAIDICLKEIKLAFSWQKPAVISSHRINFIGCIDIHNREKNLKLFYNLLQAILKKWPEVEFKTTKELGDIIEDTTYEN